MRFAIPLFALLVAACMLCNSYVSRAAPPAAKCRIGTYDSRAVCIGARGSPAFRDPVKKLQQELKDAQAAKDEKRVAQIKQRGSTMQTLRHMQGFSTMPVDDLMESIKDKLPAIAREAGVDVIVDRVNYHGNDVETVDVTDAIVKAFEPDAATLKTVEESKKIKPISLAEALELKD